MKRQKPGVSGDVLVDTLPMRNVYVPASGKEREGPHTKKQPSIFKTAWRGWLRFADVLGTFQMMVILSIIYWTLVPIIAIPLKLFSDPLALRRSGGPKWVEHHSSTQTLDEMTKQY